MREDPATVRSQVLYPALAKGASERKPSNRKDFPASTTDPRTHLFTPKKAVVCTGFAVRAASSLCGQGPADPRWIPCPTGAEAGSTPRRPPTSFRGPPEVASIPSPAHAVLFILGYFGDEGNRPSSGVIRDNWSPGRGPGSPTFEGQEGGERRSIGSRNKTRHTKPRRSFRSPLVRKTANGRSLAMS